MLLLLLLLLLLPLSFALLQLLQLLLLALLLLEPLLLLHAELRWAEKPLVRVDEDVSAQRPGVASAQEQSLEQRALAAG